MSAGLLLSDDLIFTSRITGTARDLGLTIQAARTPEALLALARQAPPRVPFPDSRTSPPRRSA